MKCTHIDECSQCGFKRDVLRRELAEMVKQRDGYAQQSDERWVAGDAALLRGDRLERELAEANVRLKAIQNLLTNYPTDSAGGTAIELALMVRGCLTLPYRVVEAGRDDEDVET